MAWKTAFVNEMILKTLNQHQQTVPPTVQKAATLDDEVGQILNRKNVNDHKAKLYSDVLQKYLTAKEQITPTGNLSPVVTQITPCPCTVTNQFWKLFLKIQDTSGKHATFP